LAGKNRYHKNNHFRTGRLALSMIQYLFVLPHPANGCWLDNALFRNIAFILPFQEAKKDDSRYY